MSWTTPRLWVASEVVTAAIMNQHIGDNLSALRAAAVFTEDSSLAATKKFYLDGGGNTYLVEQSADTVALVTGATTAMTLTPTAVSVGADFVVPATSKVRLDGNSSGDTYLAESAANVVTLTVGGIASVIFGAAGILLPATLKLYVDGGGDTYIYEQSANVLRCISGGSGGVDLTSGATSWAAVSDERLKVILEPIQDAGAKVASLRAVIGRFASDDDSRRRAFLIAQDVQRVLPEAVTEGEDGLLRLAYTDVIPLLVAAITELQTRLAALEGRLA